MRVRFLAPTDTDAGRLPAGTVVEHPDCFLLADLGLAVDFDEEATKALEKWRAGKPSPGEQDQRYLSWRFAGRDVPTVFTLPDGSTLTVGVGPDDKPQVTEGTTDA